MTTEALMQTCAELGIKLSLKEDDDNRLLVDAPKGSLNASLREQLAARKADLLAALKAKRAAELAQVAAAAAQPIIEKPASTTAKPPEAIPLILEQPLTNSTSPQQAEAEVDKLLAGSPYDESIVNSSDSLARQSVSAKLLAAITGKDTEQRSRALEAFVMFGFLSEASLQLRTANSPAERAAAARKLGVVGNRKGSKQLIESLDDSAPEVRRACVESLGQMGDPSAIAPLNI